MASTPRSDRVELFAALVFGGLLLGGWEAVCRAGLVNRHILVPPSDILQTLYRAFLGDRHLTFALAESTVSSLQLLAVGFLLGAVVGIAAGIVIGSSDTAYKVAGPVLGMLLPIPAIAWVPIAIVWFGLGRPAIIAIVSYACFSEVLYSTMAGVRGIPRRYHWVLASFGGGGLSSLLRITLPAAVPQIIVGLKLGLAASWRALIGSEMFAGVAIGLGVVLYQAREFYATSVMFASLALVALFSLLIERVAFSYLERRTIQKWGLSQTLEF